MGANIPGSAPLACWFESLAVASHPLQRRSAETIFHSVRILDE
jgi:hypothetical protein